MTLAAAVREFCARRRRRASGRLRWLRPVCWAAGHDEGTNGRLSWCRRCGTVLWRGR